MGERKGERILRKRYLESGNPICPFKAGWGEEVGAAGRGNSQGIESLGNGSVRREVLRWARGVGKAVASTPLGKGPFLWTGHTLVLPPLPPGLGLLPYSLAFLLFWFNKTKSGACRSGLGGAARPHPNHQPQVPEPSSSWGSHFNASTPSLCSLLALRSPQPFSVFLGPGGMRETDSQMELGS